MHAGIPEPQCPLHNAHLPSSSHAADISGLLDGLDAHDFDDFDDGAEDVNPARRTPSPEIDEFYTPPPPVPADIPPVVSFATAAGRQLANPSEAAMSRAMKIVREAERDAELEDAPAKRRRKDSPAGPPASTPVGESSSSGPVFANPPPESPLVHKGFAMASGRDAPAQSDAARARALAYFGDEESPAKPGASGFQLGSGSIVPPPSADARARALALFGEERTPARQQATSGFQLGSGSTAPPPPSDARARALALFAKADSSAGPTPPPTSGFSTGFQTGSGTAAQAPKAESMAFALALFNEEPTPSSPGIAAPQRPASPSFNPPRSNRPTSPAFTAPRPTRTSSFSAPARPSTPSRVPLATMTNTSTNAMSTPVMKLSKRINIQTPSSTPRRIGLGAGMGSARGKPKKGLGFTTPFKRGGGAQSVPAPSALRTPLTMRTPVAKTPEPVKIYKSVFDLAVPPNRQGMRAAFLYPGFYKPVELGEMGLPDEIWGLNLTNGEYYQFIGEDGRHLGTAQAFERLKVEGCDLVTQKWVVNHWRLILWKIAGQVMAKPSLFDEKWNWFEVIFQLKYRYEREFGAAQRPIVRRIQEHDSSPSLPMVLCVTAIHRPVPMKNERDELVPQKPYVDLTDGWYIIRALLDDCLERALDKGKIRVGRKLGLSGAKLTSGSDGADVLEAYEKSHLVLSGNSTHLAKWDARLGLQRLPFIAGLSSLSVDGGAIVLMDLILDRVYPLAYMSGDRGSREQPWGEEEENAKSDAWKDKFETESSRLREELQQSLEKIQELASILASHAEDVGAIRPGSPPDVEADFDDLMEARNVMGALRTLSPTKIVALATYARQRALADAESGRAEIEAQLTSACPRRTVRDFRMVRVRDGREGNKERARTAMLNVWDAKALGDELKEGRRFLVSSLIPGRAGDWAPPKPGTIREVYLHTRRETRWQAVE